MTLLSKRFNAEQKALGRFRRLWEHKVVRWEYWEWPKWYWDPEKFLEQRQNVKRVPKDEAKFAYGHDKENRVVLIHRFSLGKPRELDSEHFLRYSSTRTISGSVVLGDKLSDVFEATVSDDHIVRLECLFGTALWNWKDIEWEKDRVSAVTYGIHFRKAHAQVLYSPSGKAIKLIELSKPRNRAPRN